MCAARELELLPVDEERIEEEWGALPSESSRRRKSLNAEYSVALKYSEKNRYVDVLPYDISRVSLTPSEDNPDGYINANLVQLPHSQAIATQGPLPQTFLEFWQMIWEMDVRIIVMLTKLLERRRVKAHCYWPTEESGPQTFGGLQIASGETKEHENFVVRSFALSKDSEQREIYQVQYTDWPDFGVPESSGSILELLEVVENHREKISAAIKGQSSPTPEGGIHPVANTPFLVHCSAGIGRCGTLLSIFSAVEQLAEGLPPAQISIPSIVGSLRKHRAGMVQTKDQYAFIYRVVNDYLAARNRGVTSFLDQKPAASEQPSSALSPHCLMPSRSRSKKRDLRNTKRPYELTARTKKRNALSQTKTDWGAPSD